MNRVDESQNLYDKRKMADTKQYILCDFISVKCKLNYTDKRRSMHDWDQRWKEEWIARGHKELLYKEGIKMICNLIMVVNLMNVYNY